MERPRVLARVVFTRARIIFEEDVSIGKKRDQDQLNDIIATRDRGLKSIEEARGDIESALNVLDGCSSGVHVPPSGNSSIRSNKKHSLHARQERMRGGRLRYALVVYAGRVEEIPRTSKGSRHGCSSTIPDDFATLYHFIDHLIHHGGTQIRSQRHLYTSNATCL